MPSSADLSPTVEVSPRDLRRDDEIVWPSGMSVTVAGIHDNGRYVRVFEQCGFITCPGFKFEYDETVKIRRP